MVTRLLIKILRNCFSYHYNSTILKFEIGNNNAARKLYFGKKAAGGEGGRKFHGMKERNESLILQFLII